jgi:geranylgeranyl pyrophosphate synthase
MEWADELALAWLLDYTAAHLMDSVQDGDEPDAWWVAYGVGVALSAITGLLFSASLALSYLSQHRQTKAYAGETLKEFSQTFLVMGSGQHADLTSQTRTLDEFWQQAEAKSGAFFSLACRAGARLAGPPAHLLTEYAQYGHHLGLLIQITDELEDVRPSPESVNPGQRQSFVRSLPVVYALEVLPAAQAERLSSLLPLVKTNPEVALEALELVDQSRASAYLLTMIELHKKNALVALEKVNARTPAKEQLIDLIAAF